MSPERVIVVAARNEQERITATLEALARAFPGARVFVVVDGSTDATATLAARAGAELSGGRPGSRGRGKGGAMTAATEKLIDHERSNDPRTFVFCDGDLGESAANLAPLAEAVERGDCDLAVAAFAQREGGGFGVAVGFSRWAIRRLTGLELAAPISGQRAIRGSLVPTLLPFAPRFGIETAMTVDAVRAGARVREIELDLEHRATGRDLAGFVHRGRQLVDFLLVYVSRRRHRPRKPPA
jgi:glycosyltransferase involved in cell wall biosynthesis